MANYADPAVNRVLTLIRGFEGGYYDLPQPVLAARRAVANLAAARTEAAATYGAIHPGAVQQDVVADVLASAPNGKLDIGSVQPILDTAVERERLERWMLVLDAAEAQAAHRLPTVARDHADEIVVDGLRPALEKVLNDLRALHAKVDLRTIPFGNETALARADKVVRDAYLKAGEIADTYGVLRSAQATLRDLVGSPSEDAFARFREMSNPFEVFPLLGAWNSPPPPWETLPGGKAVWIAITPEAAIWMPTADECEAAYEARVASKRFTAQSTGAAGVFVPQS